MKLGWRDEEYEEILREAIKLSKDTIITDISSPPGTGKTYNTIKYAVYNKKSIIASFPNHENQATALNYIASVMEEKKPSKLPFFVLDYAGVENYCIFLNPELLMKYLDNFKEYEDDSYKDAVENMLSHPLINSILLMRGVDVDEIWFYIGELLDEYVKTKDKRKFIEEMKMIIKRRGQQEICRNVCPVGMMYYYYRKNVYKDLSEGKIITWRKDRAEKLRQEYKKVGKHIIVANPENLVENLPFLLAGKYNVNNVLCPRLLLISKASLTRKGNVNYITVRRSIILTPHAGLQFIINVVRRSHEIQGLKPKHMLFIDEYDNLLSPVSFRVYSLSHLYAIISISESIINRGVGREINGIYIDDYLYRYAEYMKTVAEKIINVVETSIKTKKYHPLVNMFTEGAFSSFYEETLKVGSIGLIDKLKYEPLTPRPVHIKYFLGDDLLSLILNEKLYFRELIRTDEDWRTNIQTAHINYAKLAQVKVHELHPYIFKTLRGKELGLVRRIRNANLVKVIEDIREYLSPLIDHPRYAVFFGLTDSNELLVSSIDIPLYNLLKLKGIFASATPVKWNLYVNGPNPRLGIPSTYLQLTEGSLLSTVNITKEEKEEFFDRVITRYSVKYLKYTMSGKEKIINYYLYGVIPDKVETTTVKGEIKQISVLSTYLQAYSKLLKIHYTKGLPPLYTPDKTVRDRMEVISNKRRSVKPYFLLLFSLKRSKKNDYVLLLVQNKKYSKLFATALKSVLCRKNECGDNIRKPTHYSSPKHKVDITWFRSRGERGIDLPNNYKYVIVVGSPYPKPSTIVKNVPPPSQLTTSVASFNSYYVKSFNSKDKTLISITHIPQDLMSGISELTQAIGRATRQAMRNNTQVTVFIPYFLKPKIEAYAPLWLKLS